MRPQKVHFGHTQAGRPGLFTGNYLAVPLSAEETSNPAVVARRMGFEYEERTDYLPAGTVIVDEQGRS